MPPTSINLKTWIVKVASDRTPNMTFVFPTEALHPAFVFPPSTYFQGSRCLPVAQLEMKRLEMAALPFSRPFLNCDLICFSRILHQCEWCFSSTVFTALQWSASFLVVYQQVRGPLRTPVTSWRIPTYSQAVASVTIPTVLTSNLSE